MADDLGFDDGAQARLRTAGPKSPNSASMSAWSKFAAPPNRWRPADPAGRNLRDRSLLDQVLNQNVLHLAFAERRGGAHHHLFLDAEDGGRTGQVFGAKLAQEGLDSCPSPAAASPSAYPGRCRRGHDHEVQLQEARLRRRANAGSP
jgi:hypothetical protein